MGIETQAYMISPDQLDLVWPSVEKMIDQAYKVVDEIVPPDLLEQLRQRHRQLWIVGDGEKILAAILTKIVQLPSCRCCLISACAGTEGDRWLHLIEEIEAFARFEGCGKVQMEGRIGWERKFPRYKRVRIVLEKEL